MSTPSELSSTESQTSEVPEFKLEDLPDLPDDLNGALSQALVASQAALAKGYKRLQVEILIPDLKPDVLAYPFNELFEGEFAFAFADAGAAALASHQWQKPEWKTGSIREAAGQKNDVALIFVTPSLAEIEAVEELCDRRNSNVSTDKKKDTPVLVINPQLQDTGTAGVGLSGRRLRERFISTLEPCYFLQSFGDGALFRVYPYPWMVWKQEEGRYKLLQTLESKPSGEELAQIFAPDQNSESFIGSIRRFIRALQN